MAVATSTFKVTGWDEDRSSTETPRVRPASITYDLPEMDGKITSSYLMTYMSNGNATFVFTETVLASNFFGKKGSFITQGQGTFDSKTYAVEASFSIVAGTGTGDLADMAGKGTMVTKPSNEYSFEVWCNSGEHKPCSSKS
ncbi:hypothetical protein ABBQ32_010658 [Trebouxia sp. C0010 RCD-2024]